MPQIRSTLVLVLALTFLLPLSSPAPAQDEKQDLVSRTVTLEELLKEVKAALAVAERDAEQRNLLPLKSVELKIQTAVSKEQGGTFKLLVLKLGSKKTLSQTQTLKLTLTPPGPSKEKGGIATGLSRVILSASEAVKTAQASDLGYEPQQVVAEYSFGIKGDRSGSFSLEVLPMSLEVGGASTLQATQTITVTFEKPKEPK